MSENFCKAQTHKTTQAHMSLNMNLPESEPVISQKMTSYEQKNNNDTIYCAVTSRQLVFESGSLSVHINKVSMVDIPAPSFKNIAAINPESSEWVDKRHHGWRKQSGVKSYEILRHSYQQKCKTRQMKYVCSKE